MSLQHGGDGIQSSSHGVRVLIADDDEKICRGVASGLSSAGYQVVTALDGTGAISQAAETPPDVAIVDLGMPTSGLDVIRHLKKTGGSAVHVIVLTGRDDEMSRRDAFEAGGDDFVIKPVGLAELKQRLAAAVRTQRAFVEARLGKEAADRRMTYGAEAAALLAHDLNNSLAVSLSNLQFLSEEMSGTEDQRDAMASTIRSLRRMSGLVANFVDIARFEDAAVKPMVASVRVSTMIASVLEVSSSLLSRGVSIEIDCDPEFEALFDEALVERVLHNLVGNAARYCNQGGRITVMARPWNYRDSLELAVANTGPHVPENIRPHLFGKYVRGGGGKRGMGLYFSRLVAEAHGGRIDYESGPNGPCFVMRLPGRA